MVRLAPNLYHHFTELPAVDRFAECAKLGFDAVEWHFPYEMSKEDLKRRLDDNGLKLTYAVVPADWANGNFGWGGQPGQEEAFRRAADQALDYAAHCPIGALNVGHGLWPAGVERQRCIDTYVGNLQYICDQARGLDVKLVTEPVTSARFKLPFVLNTMAQAREVYRQVNRPNYWLVYDTYHLRMEETGSLIDVLDENWPYVGHVQFGNAPTRAEPGVGEIDFDYVAARIDAKGYAGWIGLEYQPSGDSWTSLTWARRYGYKV